MVSFMGKSETSHMSEPYQPNTCVTANVCRFASTLGLSREPPTPNIGWVDTARIATQVHEGYWDRRKR